MVLFNNTTFDASEKLNNSTSTSLLIELSLWPLRLTCPLLFICCPIANWICIRVFQSRVYSRSSSKWYFISIAIFDTIYVVVTAPLIFLITFKIYILNWSIILCKSFVFLNYLSCQISAGLLACLSIDRLVATTCLSIYRYHCTTKLSSIVCIVVILVFSIVNSHYLIGWTIDSNGHCNVRRYEWYNQNYARLNVVYLLSYSIIPFTIITICNIFIVFNVCRNKTNMNKKYHSKHKDLPNQQESILTQSTFDQVIIKTPANVLGNNHNEENGSNPTAKYLTFKRYSSEMKKIPSDASHEMLAYMNDKQVMNKMTNTNPDWRSDRNNRLSEKLLLVGDEPPGSPPGEGSSFSGNLPLNHRRCHSQDRGRSSSTSNIPSSNYSQKMCVQLQITISLLAISICFIFCTLPNCISTFMIQAYSDVGSVRELWQAMNYFSIVPLLITHSGVYEKKTRSFKKKPTIDGV